MANLSLGVGQTFCFTKMGGIGQTFCSAEGQIGQILFFQPFCGSMWDWSTVLWEYVRLVNRSVGACGIGQIIFRGMWDGLKFFCSAQVGVII